MAAAQTLSSSHYLFLVLVVKPLFVLELPSYFSLTAAAVFSRVMCLPQCAADLIHESEYLLVFIQLNRICCIYLRCLFDLYDDVLEAFYSCQNNSLSEVCT